MLNKMLDKRLDGDVERLRKMVEVEAHVDSVPQPSVTPTRPTGFGDRDEAFRVAFGIEDGLELAQFLGCVADAVVALLRVGREVVQLPHRLGGGRGERVGAMPCSAFHSSSRS